MDLKDIAAVSGKGGLFKVLKPTRTGVILESIDEHKTKLIANANSRVSLLKEISVYTTSKEASLPLENVFRNIYEKFGKSITVSVKSEDKDLKSFLETVVPDYDTERVYNSDIKKIVSWYSILSQHFPEVFEKKEAAPEKKEEAPKEEKKAKTEKVAKEEVKTVEAKEKKTVKKETKAEDKEKPKAKSAAKKK
jgi:hypothetical protein